MAVVFTEVSFDEAAASALSDLGQRPQRGISGIENTTTVDTDQASMC
jgi:uncharacterized protein involved in propanediol utilization